VPPRVLVVDKAATTRDQLADLLGGLVSDIVWATRAAAPIRAWCERCMPERRRRERREIEGLLA
jgi:CheY-like chemotaxis protein